MDLYAILGIARSASSGDVDRAYRRLARQFHPGLNPGDPHAAARFEQVEAAYQVLSNREHRLAYDRQGTAPALPEPAETTVAFAGFDFSATVEGPGAATFSELFADVFQDAARRATSTDRGLSVDVPLRLSFVEAARGGLFSVPIARQMPCAECHGQGWTHTPPAACPECAGQGVQRSARGHMVFSRTCERCDGRGHLNSQVCRSCAGAGLQARGETVMVHVPPCVDAGTRLVLTGRGHAARGAAPGDLYVTVEIEPHAYFRRSGRDLLVTVPIAVHEAALGARIDVPTLAGPVKVRIPPGAGAGQQLRVRGLGAPGPSGDGDDAGDLLIDLQLVLPPVRDERSRELLREFGKLNDVDVRKHLFWPEGT
jgi:molecular chaperone DnaJ